MVPFVLSAGNKVMIREIRKTKIMMMITITVGIIVTEMACRVS